MSSKLSSNTASLQSILEAVNNLPNGAEGDTNTSDATATAAEIFQGKIAYAQGRKLTGTFTIDEELNTQDDLIAQIVTALEGKAAGGEIEAEYSENEDAIINRTITSYTNNRITTIGDFAFYECRSLNTVSFSACTSIGYSAFEDCFGLKSISFPACTRLTYNAFRKCSSLTTISFPVCVRVDASAFEGCRNLTTALFPVCKVIQGPAFSECYNLTTISFPVCESIGRGAFYKCSNLTTVDFPSCITITSSSAFEHCFNLETVSFPVCTTIGDRAFEGCSNLKFISLPACTTIGWMAFHDCYRLSAVYLNASSVCVLDGSRVFESTPFTGYKSYFNRTPHIYVPRSLITAYQSATNWTYFSSYFSAIESLEE